MPQSVVSMIDHAVLHPTQTDADLRAACQMCAELGVASVCVKPSMVALAAELLAGSQTVPSTVIGFPHGGTSTETKVLETKVACAAGAREVDMVVNIGKVLAQDWDFVLQDISAVVAAAREGDAITKVIFETGLLPDDPSKIRLCELSEQAGAAFVKTSTGFGFVKDDQGNLASTGATEHDIKLMRKHCSEKVAVKASGGIRSFADAQKLVALGATRLGTSGTQAIAAGEQGDSTASGDSY
ncbi:MAG: deoxyribose-phosphate aldolase [Planctomycetota bacterium]